MTGSNADRLGVVSETTADRGTPAEAWAGVREARPPVELDGWDRVVVVAPHPDDEVLGVGGLMAALGARGSDVSVVAVTDGTAAYPTLDPARLAATRAAESEAACADLGVRAPHRLRLPDGAVGDHEAALTERLRQVLEPGTVCLATWQGDGHPDHEAVGRAAAEACAATGSRLVEYPVWMWHWAVPGDARVPWQRARGLRLGADLLDRKRRAVRRFVSQLHEPAPGIEPILPPFVIERLVTDNEVVLW